MSRWPGAVDRLAVTIFPDNIHYSIGMPLIACLLGAGFGSATWPTASKALFVPFVVPRPFLAVKMVTQNGVAVSGNVDVGIYDVAGNRLVSKGSTAQAGTTALQSYDIADTELLPGIYYKALVLDNVIGAFPRWAPVAGLARAFGVLEMATAFVLPATATFAVASSAYIPYFGVTGRVLV